MEAISDIRSPPNIQHSVTKQITGNNPTATSDNSLVVGTANSYSFGGQASVVGSFKQPNAQLPATTPTSPLKDHSPFRFPELPHHAPVTTVNIGRTTGNAERRDSLFERTDQLGRSQAEPFRPG